MLPGKAGSGADSLAADDQDSSQAQGGHRPVPGTGFDSIILPKGYNASS